MGTYAIYPTVNPSGRASPRGNKLRAALLCTSAFASIAIALPTVASVGLITATPAFAETRGGNGGANLASGLAGGAGGGYGQNGGNGSTGTTGGGGGGPGPVGTAGGLPGNNSGGFGGTGGANGSTGAAVPVGSFTGAAGGNALPSVDATTLSGGGGGAGGYGLVLTTSGPHTTTAGQIFTGGAGGAANGNREPGISGSGGGGGVGGSGGGGVLLQAGGTFTNVAGASLIGGAGGTNPSVHSGPVGFSNAGYGLETSLPGSLFSATVSNAGTITGGAGGAGVTASGAMGVSAHFASNGGVGVAFLGGGSVINTSTGIITGGVAGAGFAGSPNESVGGNGLVSGVGLLASGGGSVTNDGQIAGGAGPNGPVAAPGSRQLTGSAFAGAFTTRGSAGGVGLETFGPSVAIVNNASGVIRGGVGGNGGSGVRTGNVPVAGNGGEGGRGISLAQGSILNFGQVLGGNAGNAGNATAAGQVGGGYTGTFQHNLGGAGVAFGGEFTTTGPASLDNRGIIAGGRGENAGTSGAGAVGANGDGGGAGVSAAASAGNAITILNSGSITGGNGGAASAGTTNGTPGAGGAGISMRGDGTITTSGAIVGGLSGDGVTRADAITFLSGIHTLTLQTGATFTGNVVVNTTASSNPGVSANNTLNLDSASTGTISLAQFINLGHLTQTGAGGGAWTLTGTGAFANDATLASGTMSIATGAVLTVPSMTVTGSGVLGGTGTVAGTLNVNNGGVLAPGNSIGVINVNGNLVLGAGAIYRVEVAPTNGSADRTNATGSASLGGTLNAVATGGTYTPGSRYTVLHADGGLNGQFASVTFAPGSFGTFRPIVVYDTANNNVDLLIAQGLVTPFLVNGTPNQRAVAGAVDTALTAGSSLAPFLALFPLNGAQLNAALDQLSGEVHVSTAGVLVDESRYPREAILGRLRQASYGGNTQMASLTMGGPQTAFADPALDSALAYAKSPIVTKAPMRAPRVESDVVFWAQGFGARGRFETDGNAATVQRDLAGFISGVDTRVGSNGRLGVAAGYTGSKNGLDTRGSADVETAHIAGYGGWNLGNVNLRAGGAYAFHSISTDRTVAFPGFADRLTANYDGHTGQVFGELGYGFAFGNVAIEPFAGAAWVRVQTDGAAERGGLAALNFAGTTFETAYATLGVRFAGMVSLASDMMLIPRATLAWQHAFDNVIPTGVLAFQGAPVPFTIAGVPIARDSLLAEAGLDLAIGRNATIGVSYTGQIASNVQDHAAKGKFTWKF